MKFLSISKVSEKNRTTIVSRAAEILDIERGDEVVFYLNDEGEVVLKKG